MTERYLKIWKGWQVEVIKEGRQKNLYFKPIAARKIQSAQDIVDES